MLFKPALMGAAFCILTAGVASAHTSFIKPQAFDLTRGKQVTLYSSFTDDFSNPEIGVKSQNWHYIAPNGVPYAYDTVAEFKQVTVLEGALAQEGTYRFTSGERLGRKGKMIRTPDGGYRPAHGESGEEALPAAGETMVTSQTATVADVFVSRGAPTRKAVDTRVGRLVLAPVSHPNEIYLDEGFVLDVLFDGAPLAGQEMTLYREGGAYADDKGEMRLVSDKDGRLDIRFGAPGVYLLMTRHQAVAPEGAETEIRSYTTSLTFEVTR